MSENFLEGSLLEGSLSERAGGAAAHTIRRFVTSERDGFSASVKMLELRPERDFRNADLTEVDFSHANLAGFDFTGSDLRGAIGFESRWDETTVFEKCDVSNSIFDFYVSSQRELVQNPQLINELNVISRQDIADQLSYVHDLAKHSDNNKKERGVRLAQILFASTKGLVAKNNMLYCVMTYSKGNDELRKFLIHVLSTTEHADTLRSALSIAGRLFASDRVVRQILFRHLMSDRHEIAQAILEPIIKNASDDEIRNDIVPYILSSSDEVLKNMLIPVIARRANLAHYIPRNFYATIDIRKGISEQELRASSAYIARSDAAVAIRQYGGYSKKTEATEADINFAYRKSFSLIQKLNNLGLKIKIISNRENIEIV